MQVQWSVLLSLKPSGVPVAPGVQSLLVLREEVDVPQESVSFRCVYSLLCVLCTQIHNSQRSYEKTHEICFLYETLVHRHDLGGR
jgi:hypothetical protein